MIFMTKAGVIKNEIQKGNTVTRCIGILVEQEEWFQDS